MTVSLSSGSKLFQQLHCLTSIEIKRFRNVIKKDHSSERTDILSILLRAMKNGQPEPDKEDVYTKVFKGVYTKEKDYIIRNEYRLISEELEQFLAAAPADVRAQQYLKLNYLARLLQSGAYHLFLIEKKALLKEYPHSIFLKKEIARVESDYYARNRLQNLEAIAEYRELIDTFREESRAEAMLYASEIYIREAFIYRTLKGYGAERSLPEQPEFIDIPASVQADVAYNLLKARQYLQMGEEKIATLRRMQEEHKKCLQLSEAETYFASATIGLELMIMGRYGEAVGEFEETLALPGYTDSPLFRTGGLLNHLSGLAKAGEYKRFEDMYHRFLSLIQVHPYRFRLEIMRSVVLLNLGDFRKARAVVRDFRLEDKSSDAFYLRVLFACSYLGEGDLVAAAYELENLQRALRGAQTAASYQFAAQVLRTALRWAEKPTDANRNRLRNLLTQLRNSPSQELEISPVAWISRFAGLDRKP